MPSSLIRLARPVLSGLLSMLLLVSPLRIMAEETYLREIEDEIKRQAAALTTTAMPPAPFATASAPAEQLTGGLDRPGFDQALRQSLPPATYAAFQKLTPRNQQQVYESYRSDNHLASISAQITQLAAGKP